MWYILISAGMKFRNRKKFGTVYRRIPVNYEHWKGAIVVLYEEKIAFCVMNLESQ
jgi:hypothetical protein